MRRNQRKKYKKSNEKIIKYCLYFVILLLIVVIFSCFLKNLSFKKNLTNDFNSISNENFLENDIYENSIENTQIDNNTNKDVSFTLTALGDTLCHNTQYWDAYNKNTSEYDFSYVYSDIENYTRTSDIVIGSLETTFAGEDVGYSNYPTFNSPDSLATALKKIGVNIISTAGNHCLDYGYSGLSRTIDVLENNNLSHLGTYKTKEDQEKILVKNVKGVKIAFINYTYGTNGIPVPSDKPYCVNLIDKDLILKQISEAQKQKVDIIVACMHWGTEYQTTANSEQKELADFLFNNGVDIILGNHPHVIEPMEKRTITLEDGTQKEVFVVYALGNFTADQRAEITRDSAILNIKITKKSNGYISIDNVNYVPIYMFKNSNAQYHKFKILDIEKTIYQYENNKAESYITSSVYNNLKIQLEKIKNILGDEIK